MPVTKRRFFLSRLNGCHNALHSHFAVPLSYSVHHLEHLARSSVTVEESTPVSGYYPELNPSLVIVNLTKN